MTEQATSKKHFWINLLVLVLVFYFARREIIRWSALDEDELISWSLVRLPWKEFFLAIYHDTQQSLYYSLLKIIHSLFPLKSDESIRTVSLLFSIGTLQVLFAYFSKIFKPVVTALVLFMFLCHPEFKYYSVYARPYPLLYLLVAINSCTFFEIFFNKNKRAALRTLFCFSLIALFLTHYLGYFYFGALLISSVFLKHDFFRGWSKTQLSAIGGFFIFHFGATLYQWQFKSFISWVSNSPANIAYALKSLFSVTPSMPLTLTLFFLCFAVYFLFHLIKNKHIHENAFFSLIVVMSGLTLFGIFSFLGTPVFVSKYLFILFPFVLILLASALSFYNIESNPGIIIALALIGSNFRGLEKDENAWKFDAKSFLTEVKQLNIIGENSKVLCNVQRGPHKIFSGYSEVYFSRDICSLYRNSSVPFSENEYDFIINLKNVPADDQFKQKSTYFHVLYSSRDVELLKRNQ